MPTPDFAIDALLAEQSRLQRIASNLANVTTAGFRREIDVPRRVERSFADWMRQEGAVVRPAATPVRDTTPAPVRATGEPLDLALTGPGYFELDTTAGPVYTRVGRFRSDGRGRLVDGRGDAVTGSTGEISLGGGRLEVAADGTLLENGRPIGRLQLLDWPAEQLTALGDGRYAARGTPAAVSPAGTQVRQGFLEGSNVNPAREMVDLTETMRRFEAMLRFVQARDELVGSAIRRLGEP